MNFASVDRHDDEDHQADGAPEAPTPGGRRGLIRAAASGFALAASGLILPAWLEEADAKSGALGGAGGGRHGQNRRGRHGHKKRSHGNNKHEKKDRKPVDLIPTHPAMEVRNRRREPVQNRAWRRDCINETCDWYIPSGWDWEEIPISRHGVREFRSDFRYVAAQIATDRVVYIDFVWPYPPTVEIYSGGWEKNGNPKGQRLAGGGLWINDSISVPGIKATRGRDDSTYVWLYVELT